MWRKLAWLVAGIGVWAMALAALEHRRVRQEAELWATATDPLA